MPATGLKQADCRRVKLEEGNESGRPQGIPGLLLPPFMLGRPGGEAKFLNQDNIKDIMRLIYGPSYPITEMSIREGAEERNLWIIR
jgi:hypothetical protein